MSEVGEEKPNTVSINDLVERTQETRRQSLRDERATVATELGLACVRESCPSFTAEGFCGVGHQVGERGASIRDVQLLDTEEEGACPPKDAITKELTKFSSPKENFDDVERRLIDPVGRASVEVNRAIIKGVKEANGGVEEGSSAGSTEAASPEPETTE